MDDVGLGEAQRQPAYNSPGTASASDDERNDSSDDQPAAHAEPLAQRLRGSLSGLRQSLVHGDGASNGGSARDRLRSAMQRMRNKDSPSDNQDESDADDEHELSRRSLSQQLRSALSASGLSITNEDKLVLLGSSPLVQPQDDELFLERSSSLGSLPTLQRGDYIRVQSPDDRSQSWLCQIAVDRLHIEADVIPLATPFPGSLVPDAIIHFVPRECLPTGLTDDDDEDAVESEHVSELRSSVDAWRPSVDDPADSTDDDDAMERDPRFSDSSNNSTRTSVAREKAAALYENFKSKKARLRTSSSDYKEKIKQVGKEKLAVASQVSKQKLAVASQVSKEKLAVASQVSKEKLAVASQASKEKLAAASVVSKEKLAVASQASKEKLVVAGQASKLKVQSWTSSARSSFKAKMAQRAETKAAAAAGSTGEATADPVDNTAVEASPDVFTIEDPEDEQLTKPLADYRGEEAQLRREVEQC